MVYYSAWLARRWEDPAFPVAFPWFGKIDIGQTRFWRFGSNSLLEEEPLRLL